MITDLEAFEYKDSRWQDLYAFLKKKGYDVYSPATKEGECVAPYVVITNGGGSGVGTYSSDADLYTVMLYVPMKQYSKLEPELMRLRGDLKELEPLFLYSGNTTPSYYDDIVKAHMVSFDLFNYKKR